MDIMNSPIKNLQLRINCLEMRSREYNKNEKTNREQFCSRNILVEINIDYKSILHKNIVSQWKQIVLMDKQTTILK